MIKRILKRTLVAFLQSFILLIIGLIIKYWVLATGAALKNILFYIGAFPIVIFSFGAIGDFKVRGSPTYQLSRSVSSQSSNQRGVQDISDLQSGLNWIIAGLLVWFYSYFL
ncbi:MAG: hypothetical protein HKM93_21355 [Desulfobacteraceae bacterium]|nr:hypothetical protein [Desulfobacteraceae bacterium]